MLLLLLVAGLLGGWIPAGPPIQCVSLVDLLDRLPADGVVLTGDVVEVSLRP